jgi:diguanylate cyclase (GGDEF)-like protein/PAS domain S-box-containing protein
VLNEPIHSIEPALELGPWFETAPEALLVVATGVVEAANERARALIGDDPVGAAVTALLPGWEPAGEPGEGSLVRASDEVLPVEIRSTPMGEWLLVSVRDARELLAGRDAMRQLVEVETRYRSLVEQIPAVVYADHGDVTIYVSPQIEQILGVTPQEYVADPDMWLRMVHPDDREWVREQSDAFLAGEGGDLDDYRMVRPDGRIVWIRDRAFAYRGDDGRVILEQGLLFDVTELKEAEARIAHMAYHDPLTGLANRQLFQESLQMAIDRARRTSRSIAVIYLDLDNFKELNDTMGHHAGDLLLVGLAERLQATTRDVDLVARQSGDEFLVLLADLDPAHANEIVGKVLDRVRIALATPIDLDGTMFVAHGSIGISRYPADAGDAETLLRHADQAMYEAKRSGSGGYRFFGDDA